MIQTKQDYLSPSTDVLDLRSEGLICQSDSQLFINSMDRGIGYGDEIVF